MNEFSQRIGDPSLTLNGGLLVEASAGTGKTYNIQNIFLRLVVVAGVRVQRILVVTFTEAATQELRERLRQILVCCEACLSGNANAESPKAAETRERLDPILRLPPDALPPDVDAHTERLRRVRRALMDFDSAAIFTIHGFCNRVLDRYAFECGSDPDAELVAEASELVANVCRDWWRQHTYHDAREPATVSFANLRALIAAVAAAMRHADADLKPKTAAAARTVAIDAFATVLADGLKRLPTADGTNDAARAIEAALQTVTQALATHPSSPPVILMRTASIIVQKLNSGKKLYWQNPVDGAKPAKIGLDDRLPGGAATAAAAHTALLAGQAEIIDQLRKRVNETIRDRGAITYDAMLCRVRDALRDPASGVRLQQVLREEFQVALVDEFQDTDPVQYETFKQVFRDGNLPLLLVGDPKQSIYRFRSGDIFAYYGARNDIACGVSALSRNFRSETNMVAAVNELFHDTPDGDPAFINAQIQYVDVVANGVSADRQWRETADAPADPCPLKLWRYPHDGRALPGQDTPFAERMCQDVANEIVRLLDPVTTVRIGERRISASDIAVLVHTHAEAARFRRAIVARGVPAIRQATDSVFDSPLAPALALLMQALLDAGDARSIRSALCSGLLPCTAEEVRRFNDPAAEVAPPEPTKTEVAYVPPTFEAWVDLMRTTREIWFRRSFVEAFRYLADRVGLWPHLAAATGEDAAEHVAAVQQLVELAHGAATLGKRSPDALLRWFTRQLSTEHREEEDAFKVRPCSDDDAVRIMTVFKAKGLEFPIVFVPTLWRRKATAGHPDDPFIAYHDTRSLQQTLDLERDETCLAQAQREQLEEDVRLVYVALTRAVNRTYLLAVDHDGNEETHALSRLLTRWQAAAVVPSYIEVHERKVDDGPIDIAPRCLPLAAATLAGPYNDGNAAVDKRFAHTSFSALAAHGTSVAATPRDIDARDGVADALPAAAAADIFLFPGGARTGDCWHHLFEALDFQADAVQRSQTVDETLDAFTLCAGGDDKERQRKREAVHAMVARVLTVPLPSADRPFTLAEVPSTARRPEVSFHFPLRRDDDSSSLARVVRILDHHWTTPARDDAFLDWTARTQRTIPMGFMTGSIDLLFEHDGRFYLLDWKSNRLDARPERFAAAGLKQEMAANAYYLQYLIYTVAVDGFLRQALRGYDYDRHFGGIFYLFLRGIAACDEHGRGVFVDRPARVCVEALSQELMGRDAR